MEILSAVEKRKSFLKNEMKTRGMMTTINDHNSGSFSSFSLFMNEERKFSPTFKSKFVLLKLFQAFRRLFSIPFIQMVKSECNPMINYAM